MGNKIITSGFELTLNTTFTSRLSMYFANKFRTVIVSPFIGGETES